MRKKGFTLIELLVVIAIIVLLVSILVPSLNYARELARRAACSANFSAIGKAFAMYSASHNDAWPQVTSGFDVETTSLASATAGGTDDLISANVPACPIEQLNPLIEEGHCQYKAFLCPSAPTGDDVTRGTGSNNDWGFYMYPDGSSTATYFVDYGIHLGWGGMASFRTLSDGDVIMADLTYNQQNTVPADADELTDSYSNHKDSGLNMLNKNGSVMWKEPEEISNVNYPVYNQDNIYTSGTSESSGTYSYQKSGGTVNAAPDCDKDMVLWIHGS